MSAEILRRAAALMRERAEDATFVYSSLTMQPGQPVPWPTEDELHVDFDEDMAPHIASWHPAVALAVADLLTVASVDWPENPEAINVARAYLGEA